MNLRRTVKPSDGIPRGRLSVGGTNQSSTGDCAPGWRRSAPLRASSAVGLLLALLSLSMPMEVWAQNTEPTIEMGVGVGLGLPSGAPSIQSGPFAEGHVDVQLRDSFWLTGGAGAIRSTSSGDSDFTLNVYHVRIALRYDIPIGAERDLGVYGAAGPIYQYFDPSGAVDAEDAFGFIGVHGELGVSYPPFRRWRLKNYLRLTTVSADLAVLPVTKSTGLPTSRAVHVYLGLAFTFRP